MAAKKKKKKAKKAKTKSSSKIKNMLPYEFVDVNGRVVHSARPPEETKTQLLSSCTQHLVQHITKEKGLTIDNLRERKFTVADLFEGAKRGRELCKEALKRAVDFKVVLPEKFHKAIDDVIVIVTKINAPLVNAQQDIVIIEYHKQLSQKKRQEIWTEEFKDSYEPQREFGINGIKNYLEFKERLVKDPPFELFINAFKQAGEFCNQLIDASHRLTFQLSDYWLSSAKNQKILDNQAANQGKGDTTSEDDQKSRKLEGDWSRPMSKSEMMIKVGIYSYRKFNSYAKRHGIRQVGNRELYQIRIDGMDARTCEKLKKP